MTFQKKNKLAILASGSGSNAEAIMRYFENHPDIEVALVMSNNSHAFVLERAKQFGIDTVVFNREEFKDGGKIIRALSDKKISHVVLAGFLWLIPSYLIDTFPDRIINIHPALLPKFGGKGMYGIKVHEAVRAANESETGITIHLVNTKYDEGKILFQATCPVLPHQTPGDIASGVLALEHEHYPKVIEGWVMMHRG